jgi:hypothetical protein
MKLNMFVFYLPLYCKRILGRPAYRWATASLAACRKIYVIVVCYSSNVFAMSSANKFLSIYTRLSFCIVQFSSNSSQQPVAVFRLNNGLWSAGNDSCWRWGLRTEATNRCMHVNRLPELMGAAKGDCTAINDNDQLVYTIVMTVTSDSLYDTGA